MKNICFAVVVCPSNLFILENFLFNFCKCLPLGELRKEIDLYVLCDVVVDRSFSVKRIDGFEELLRKISKSYGINIIPIENENRNGHGDLIDDFIYRVSSKKYYYSVIMDDDIIPTHMSWIPKLCRIINKNPQVSCFGQIIDCDEKSIKKLKIQSNPRLHSNLIVVKNSDFIEMNSIFKRQNEGHFIKQILPMDYGKYIFFDTASFYFCDLMRHSHCIFGMDRFVEDYFIHFSQGTNKMLFKEPHFIEELEKVNFFSNFGFEYDRLNYLEWKDPIYREINFNKDIGISYAYTFSSFNINFISFERYCIDFLTKNKRTIVDFNFNNEEKVEIKFNSEYVYFLCGDQTNKYKIGNASNIQIVYKSNIVNNVLRGFEYLIDLDDCSENIKYDLKKSIGDVRQMTETINRKPWGFSPCGVSVTSCP